MELGKCALKCFLREPFQVALQENLFPRKPCTPRESRGLGGSWGDDRCVLPAKVADCYDYFII